MGQIIDKTINQPPFGPKCEDDCEAKPYDKKGKICYKGECINVCPANAYIRKDGKCACEDGYKYLDQQLPGQDKLKGDGWGHCKEDKTKVKKKVKKDKKVKSGKRLGRDLEKKSQEDNKLLDFLEEQLKKNPNLTEDDLEKLFNPEPQKPIIKTVIERPEPIVRTIIERPDPIIKTVIQTVIKTPEPVVSNCVYGNRGRHLQINDSCPGKEGPNKNIRWDTIKKKWYDIENENYVETDFVREMRVPTVIPPMNGGTCYEDGKKDKIEPCSINGVERPIDGVWGSWETDRVDGDITTIDTVNSNWSNEVNGEQQNINFGKEGQECITEESLLKGTNPIQVFKREPTIVPKYGGKRLEGPSVRRKPYMYDENKMEFTTYCPINATFTKDWNSIDWNEEKCSEGYTQKKLLNESTKNFERDSNLPGYTEEERKDEDRIIGPGDRTIYRYKTRKVKRNSKHGGIPAGKWYSSTGDVPKEKYDYRIKGYDECPGVREAIEKIKSNDTEWKKLDLVTIEPKDCKPVFTWNKKWYKPFEKDSNGAIIDTTSIGEVKVRPGIGNEQARGLDGVNDPKQVLNYALNTVKKRGKFIFSSVKHSNATINSDGSWEPTQNKKGEWIQMETDDGNIQVITGVITQGDHVKNSWVKKFEVKVSRNGQSWSTLIKNNEGKTEFNGNTDKSTEKDNKFKTPIEARYIRIYPLEWNNTISMRTGYIKKGDNSVTCYGGSGLLGDSTAETLMVFDRQATIDKGYYHKGTGVECPSDGEKFIYDGGFSNFSKYKESDIHIKDGDNVIKAYKIVYKTENNLKDCGTDETHGGWSSPWSKCLKPLKSGLAPKKNNDTGEYDKEQLAMWKTDNGYQYKYRTWNSNVEGDGFKNKNDDKTYKDITEPYVEDFNIIRKSCERDNIKYTIPELNNKLILETNLVPSDDEPSGLILNIKRSEELIDPSKFKDNVYKIKLEEGNVGETKYTVENLFNGELISKANNILGEEYDKEGWVINNYEIRIMEGPNDDPRISNQEEQKKRGVNGSSSWYTLPGVKNVRKKIKGRKYYPVEQRKKIKGRKYYPVEQIKRIQVPNDVDFTYKGDGVIDKERRTGAGSYDWDLKQYKTNYLEGDEKEEKEMKNQTALIDKFCTDKGLEPAEMVDLMTFYPYTSYGYVKTNNYKQAGENYNYLIKDDTYWDTGTRKKGNTLERSLPDRWSLTGFHNNQASSEIYTEEKEDKKFIFCRVPYKPEYKNKESLEAEYNTVKFRLDTNDLLESSKKNKKESFASIDIGNKEKPKKYKKESFRTIKPDDFHTKYCVDTPEQNYVLPSKLKQYTLQRKWKKYDWRNKRYVPTTTTYKSYGTSEYTRASCKDIGRVKTQDAVRQCFKTPDYGSWPKLKGGYTCDTSACCDTPFRVKEDGSLRSNNSENRQWFDDKLWNPNKLNESGTNSCKDYECPVDFVKKGVLNRVCPDKYDNSKPGYQQRTAENCVDEWYNCKEDKCTPDECCTKIKRIPGIVNTNSICLPGYDCNVIPVGIIIQRPKGPITMIIDDTEGGTKLTEDEIKRLKPKSIRIKAGKNSNGSITWSAKEVNIDIPDGFNDDDKLYTTLFSHSIRQSWKGHEHIWISHVMNDNPYYGKIAYRVNLLYGIEGYGKSLEKIS